MMIKHTALSALLAASFLSTLAFADQLANFPGPLSDIAASQNQLSLSYLNVAPSGSTGNYTGARAQLSYLGDFLVNNAYLSASVSEATATPQDVLNANNYNYDVRAGKAFVVLSDAAIVPYAHLGHEVLSTGFDSSTNNSYGAGAKALYAPMAGLVLSFDLAADRDSGDVSGAVATPVGLATAETIGVDYALTQRVHLTASYGHRAFTVDGFSASDKIVTIGLGLGY